MCVEYLNHLVWNCTLAKFYWDKLEHWFEIRVTHVNNLRTLLIQISKLKDSEGLVTCLSATLWKIWLTRNANLFSDLKLEDRTIFKLIKLRSWEWSVSNKIIHDKWFTLWNHNPHMAYSNNNKEELRKLLELWFSHIALVGFVDGAADTGITSPKAGIRGFLMDKHNRTWFIFSGPAYSLRPSKRRNMHYNSC